MNLPRDVYWKILRDQLTLKGTWNSSFLGPKLMSEPSIKGSVNGEPGNVGPEIIEAGPSATGSAAAVDDWDYVIERLSSRRVRPEGFITHRLPLDELDRGFAVMRDKTEDYCKVMMAV